MARTGPLRMAFLAGAVALVVLLARDGTPSWQAVRTVTAVVSLLAILVVMARLTPRRGGGVAVASGVAFVAIGLGFLPHVVKALGSIASLCSLVLVVSGLVLVVLGTVEATRGLGRPSRSLAAASVLIATVVVAFVLGPAVAATNAPRPAIGDDPGTVGLEFEEITLRSTDGVDLAAWYVPSENGAAVVLLHGAGSTRSNVLAHAAVLARHGYGVLLLDARGNGESGGRAMAFGWCGDLDIAAATAHLAVRPDVEVGRIGLVGMSMGGEQALGAAATNPAVRAVVAEGATARTAEDEAWLSEVFGARGALQEQLERLQDGATDLLTSASVPVSARDAVVASDARFLLIAGGEVPDERHAAEHVAAAAPDRVEVWTVSGSGHTGGLATAPDEWEQRVVGFLDAALAGGPGSP